MYIQYNKSTIKGKTYSYPFLCRKYRENGSIKTEVIGNLSKFPKEFVITLENILKKGTGALVSLKDIIVKKSIDYGLVFIFIIMMRRLRIPETLEKVMVEHSARIAELMIIGKIVTRGSKLGIYNWIRRNEAISKHMGIDTDTLKLEELYSVLADMSNVQSKIERKWNLYHKDKHDTIYLYDITSTYFEGKENALAALGYNRDGKKGKMQIVIGLLTNSEGFPLSIQVFAGNVNDHTTVIGQLKQLKKEYNANNVIFVGDRGMRIRYNMEQMEEEEKEGIEYITALTIEEIKTLLKRDVVQMSLFSKELAEIEDPDSEERYILCTNPELEKEKTQKRETLRTKFEEELRCIQLSYHKRQNQSQNNKEKIVAGHKNKKLVTEFSQEQIDDYKYRVKKITEKYKMQAFYKITIDAKGFIVEFNFEKYSEAKSLDGKYIINTNVKKATLSKEQVREHYKNLKHVEHAWRILKTVRIEVRPVFHVNENTTRGHVLVAMFAYSIIRELENKIFPWLKIFNKLKKKQFSFNDIEEELKLIKLIEMKVSEDYEAIKVTELTEMQKEVFNMLKIDEKELYGICLEKSG